MWRRCNTLWLLAVMTAGWMAGAAVLPADGDEADRPNVLIILVDDLGYGDLSSYGADDLHTPHVDALLESGMRFDRFYANAPVCSPTRASLLTGRYPDMAGVPGVIRSQPDWPDPPRRNWGFLRTDVTLMPEKLGEAGYHTALIGKWHLGEQPPNLPNQRGFDHFSGFLKGMLSSYTDWNRNAMRRNGEVIRPDGHATELFTQWAISYLHRRAKNDRPFFLLLSYNAPHGPLDPPEKWLQKVRQRGSSIHPKRAKLAALIEHLDHNVGRLVRAMKAAEVYDQTLTIFTSDNGGWRGARADNGPLRGDKGTVFEGGLRVPTGVVWPGQVTAGSRSNRIALTMDLWPTIAEAVGLETPDDLDGRSILPTLRGQDVQPDPRTLFFMERTNSGKRIEAVRRGRWKLVRPNPFGPVRLFNLKKHPKEGPNLADKHPDIVKELRNALKAHLQRAGAVPWHRPVK